MEFFCIDRGKLTDIVFPIKASYKISQVSRRTGFFNNFFARVAFYSLFFSVSQVFLSFSPVFFFVDFELFFRGEMLRLYFFHDHLKFEDTLATGGGFSETETETAT